MPFGDGTGPNGNGPIGRGMGPCHGGTADQRSYAQRSGRACHRGWGMGWRHGFSFPTPEDEKARLEQRKSWLQSMLDAINSRLEALNKSTPP